MAYRDWKGVLNDKPTNKLKHLINQEQNDEIYKKELQRYSSHPNAYNMFLEV